MMIVIVRRAEAKEDDEKSSLRLDSFDRDEVSDGFRVFPSQLVQKLVDASIAADPQASHLVEVFIYGNAVGEVRRKDM